MVSLGIFMLLTASEPAPAVDPLRVASIQMEVTGQLERNLARILRGIEEAAQKGAQVALFPECALSGFAKEVVAARNDAALEKAMDEIAQSAAQHHLYVIYGCATPSGKDRPYNSALVIGPDGQEITRYHKMFAENWFAPGDHLALFEIAGIPCTVIVCHDERFPELVRIPVLAGARICFYISYEINGRESALRKAEGYRAQLIARAVENNIWVVQSNGIGPLPEGEKLSLGQSRIVSPGGIVLDEAPKLEDHMLVQDIHPSEASRGNALETARNPLLQQWYQSAQALIQPQPPSSPAPAQRDTLRVGFLQDIPVKWDLEHNFEVFLKQLAAADKQDADLFLTPECWLDGYAAPDKESTPERLREIAQALNGSTYLQRVAEEARNRHMFICFGFTSLEEGAIYNAAGLWDDQGTCLGVYHKTHLQEHDLQYTPGNVLPVWPSPWGPLGIMICADRRWPETARTLRLQGAHLILNPTYGMCHLANEWWMRTRSYENQCFIAFAHPKTSFMANPKGNLAAKRETDPGVLVCGIDLREAKDDNHLADRRPALYLPITAPYRRVTK